MTQIGMNKLRMQRFSIALPQINTVTKASEKRPIAFLSESSSSSLQHCGTEVTSNDIVVYGHDVLHQRSASDCQIATMSVPTNDLPALCKTIIGNEFLEKPGNWLIRPDPVLMSRLRKLHKAVALTLRRMHLVRRALLSADRSKATVTSIVTDHGFWELGRFSVAYRALFGEAPSETLHRPPERTAINLTRRLA
jgi:AraC-like DNA-binding protein